MPQVEQKPFLCVVASQRAGTTAFGRTLQASEVVHNFGEIFHIQPHYLKRWPDVFLNFAKREKLSVAEFFSDGAAPKIAQRYFDHLRQVSEDRIPLVDIKFDSWQVLRPAWSWPNEEPFLLRWLKKNNTAFIMIRRRDMTQQLLSVEIARISGAWHGATEDQLPETVEVPLDRILTGAKQVIWAEKLFNDKLKDHPRACFLTYEELYDGGRLASGATDFLNHVYGIDPVILPEVPVSKNAGDKRSLVKNYDQIEAEVNRLCREMGRELTA